ncbi:MAG: selenide, water dikinase SelD [Proteobacteria bacterium]|nr:selenide, water dikinase SelD [Pseudomonadota bacterium]
MNPIKLTEYSHGAGCGCKISPATLDRILSSARPQQHSKNLLVGNESKDDAAVYDLGNGSGLISTTDFFMPIVDDPFVFGQIAATNAISDVYAMGGNPVMAIAIFGWPLEKLSEETGQKVIEGGRYACQQAGMSLAGGHSIDAPEPIFGLAVSGLVELRYLQQNNTAKAGDRLFLTKAIGVGILSTAQKQKKIADEHALIATQSMCQLNSIGALIAKVPGVNAMTDVTGFGLGGHLREMCEGSGVRAEIEYTALPLLPETLRYLKMGCSPGGALRNYESYGEQIGEMSAEQQAIVCDPQTSGGLLISVAEDALVQFAALCEDNDLSLNPIGRLYPQADEHPLIHLV